MCYFIKTKTKQLFRIFILISVPSRALQKVDQMLQLQRQQEKRPLPTPVNLPTTTTKKNIVRSSM